MIPCQMVPGVEALKHKLLMPRQLLLLMLLLRLLLLLMAWMLL